MDTINLKKEVVLRPFQKETRNKIIQLEQKYNCCLLMNETGLGKTLNVIDIIVKTGLKTLIICPSFLVENWISEFEKFSNVKKENYFVYTGSNRVSNFNKIDQKKILFLITSYSILSREFHKKKGKFIKSIFNIEKFERIVCDEVHYLRNYNTCVSKSVLKLTEINSISCKKILMSATPIFNSLKDLYPVFRIMSIDEGIEDYSSFKRNIVKNPLGCKKVNKLLKKYGVQYIKKQVLKDDLQEIEEVQVLLEFSEEEQEFYTNFLEYSIGKVNTLKQLMKRLQTMTSSRSKNLILKKISLNLLVIILRIRQVCITPQNVLEDMKVFKTRGLKTLEQSSKFLEYFNKTKDIQEECFLCYDSLSDTVFNPCGHKVCRPCSIKLENFNTNKEIKKCPLCRRKYNYVVKLEKFTEPENSEEKTPVIVSTKFKKVLEILGDIFKNDEKVLIVSQWTNTLDKLQDLITENYKDKKFISLRGDIDVKTRNKSIKLFQNDKEVKVCFISLNCSSEGLNLTESNHVIILDPWWNSSKTLQVKNRIHRIGQTKKCYVYTITMKNSIEEKIIELNNKKSRMIEHVFNNNFNFDYQEHFLNNLIKFLE